MEFGEVESDPAGPDLFDQVPVGSDVWEVAFAHSAQRWAGGCPLPAQLVKGVAHAAVSPCLSLGGSNLRRISSAKPSLLFPLAAASTLPSASAITAP